MRYGKRVSAVFLVEIIDNSCFGVFLVSRALKWEKLDSN
jgi:hypothetical protein